MANIAKYQNDNKLKPEILLQTVVVSSIKNYISLHALTFLLSRSVFEDNFALLFKTNYPNQIVYWFAQLVK